MTFGEKLYKLRKEKGLSQEALADHMNTTRQAVSKWENDQAFPETEKLLILGNLFQVSIDYLLKETDEAFKQQQTGYYVSKEVVEGFMLHEKNEAIYLALGVSFCIFACIPYLLFGYKDMRFLLTTMILVTIGIGLFVTGAVKNNDSFDILKREPLNFEHNILVTLRKDYEKKKSRYYVLLIVSTCVITLGVIPIFISVKGFTQQDILYSFHAPFVLLIGIGICGFICSVSRIETYELLIENDKYHKRFGVKVLRKIRNKLDNF